MDSGLDAEVAVKVMEIDMRCMCDKCESRTKETYRLTCSCMNCGWRGTALMRNGDRPSHNSNCPNCGVCFRLSFGSDPALAALDKP